MPHCDSESINQVKRKERRSDALLKSDVRQSSDLDDSPDEVQAAGDEDVDIFPSRDAQLAHDVHSVLDGREDVDVLLRERRDEGRPRVGKLVLRL